LLLLSPHSKSNSDALSLALWLFCSPLSLSGAHMAKVFV